MKETVKMVKVERDAIANPLLTLEAKGLLSVIKSLRPGWNASWLPDMSRNGRDATIRALMELELTGYVHRRSRDPRKGGGSRYYMGPRVID